MLQQQHNSLKHASLCDQPQAAAKALIQTQPVSRRGLLASTVLLPLWSQLPLAPAQALEPQPAPAAPEPACASCVGYVDGTLGSCSGLDACSSSYDDRPAHFVAPWQYDGSTQAAMRQLVGTLQDFSASIQTQTGDYVYAVLQQGSGGSLDLEFVFAPNDTTVSCW